MTHTERSVRLGVRFVPLRWLVVIGIALLIAPIAKAADDEIGVRVPEGFQVTRYADDSLAHDIYSMTVDSLGRVVVSGPGYVKILIDTDGDGKADTAKQFADGPASGAQGMCFVGRDLLCVGDEGLIRYRDVNGDDIADGPPETFLKIPTGGEHNAHAIRRGPDGWWYLIAGNTAEVDEKFANLTTSPVKHPYAGTIIRLKPDLSGGEVFADGFRNAYDFDFDPRGDVFTYESDSERDVALPWYVPTRVFHVLPGGFHGWISDSSNRPDYFLDSAPVVAETGRGSPTGIACYWHRQFPAEYQGALFALDWTFGRVWAVPLDRQGETYTSKPVEFMTSKGEHGFAPTDVEVGSDGSLFVCVGGRGTHGTVYRVTYPKGPAIPFAGAAANATPQQKLKACIEAPQPLSSWSRARWMPLARQLGTQPFIDVAMSENLRLAPRVRAIEILTELFAGLPVEVALALTQTDSPEVRARAVWSLGRKPVAELNPQVLVSYLTDRDALVRRCALEALATATKQHAPFAAAIAQNMNDDRRVIRLSAAMLLPRLDNAVLKQISETARHTSWRAAVVNAYAFAWRLQLVKPGEFNAYVIDIGKRVLEGEYPVELKRDAVRLIELGLGDLSAAEKLPAVFDGYSSPLDLTKHERELDPIRIQIAKLFPTGDRLLDLELARVAAMISPLNPDLLAKITDQITDKSHPTDDLHYLIVAAKIAVPRGKQQQDSIANGLIGLERKVTERKLAVDSNWNDRVSELYAKLVDQDPELPISLLDHPGFGRPGHVIYMSRLTEAHVPKAVERFVEATEKDTSYPWNNDVVFVFGFVKKPEYREVVRQKFEQFDLRMAALMVLAEEPDEQDRLRFVAGLDSQPIEILDTCVTALEKLEEKKDPEELVGLVKTLRRLGEDKAEFPLRERVAKLLQRNAGVGEDFGYVLGEDGHKPQPEAVEKWTEWVSQEYPDEAAKQLGGGGATLAELRKQLSDVPWEGGDAERGQKLYTTRSCAQCHAGGKGLGPDLSGVAGRFSRDDLFTAIVLPSRDVSPRYQSTLVETKSGKVFTGLIVYESVEGVMLRNGTNQTFRIEANEIESRRNLPTSIMPADLLKGLQPGDLADLYSYLRSQTARTADAGAAKSDEAKKE
ncbi:MAG: c-type cytochrome [Planctomycetales bacterium]|nr:c-type cytochrome [Planctomycetales bacterium]